MHTTFHHELLRARVTDLHRQAARERMAKAMSSARHPQRERRTHSVPGHATVLANRIFTVLGAHGAPPTRLSRASGVAIPRKRYGDCRDKAHNPRTSLRESHGSSVGAHLGAPSAGRNT
jgi:hypothetical protein